MNELRRIVASAKVLTVQRKSAITRNYKPLLKRRRFLLQRGSRSYRITCNVQHVFFGRLTFTASLRCLGYVNSGR